MQANYVQRLRLTFRKTGPTRFIGHLDLALTLERSLNRAQIPMAYTQGFNKRPRMQMASALPLGYTSDVEWADIWLTEKMPPEEVKTQLMRRIAPGIDVYRIEEVDLKEAALQTRTVSSHYEVTFLDPVDVMLLQEHIKVLMAETAVMRERGHGRKRKAYDLRPLIYDLALSELSDSTVQIKMHLSLAPSQTGRPDEVLLELGVDPLDTRIHRTEIVLEDTE
jgi:radical SAM-linked protein